MKRPDISIIVSCWSASDIIEDSLRSIADTATDISVEVFVIDDASPDAEELRPIEEKFKQDERFTFIYNQENIGYSKTANMLLERATGKYLMTFDTDARVKPGSLRSLYDFMEQNPQAGAALGKLLNPDGSLQYYYRRILTPVYYFSTTPLGRFIDKYFLGLRWFKAYHYDDLDLTKTSEMEQPPVACLIIRREALRPDPHIFDPRFRLYMLDVDFAKTLYDRGYKIYVVHDAPVVHIKTATASRRGWTWLERELYKSFRDYFRKHYPALYPIILLTIWLDIGTRTLLRATTKKDLMR